MTAFGARTTAGWRQYAPDLCSASIREAVGFEVFAHCEKVNTVPPPPSRVKPISFDESNRARDAILGAQVVAVPWSPTTLNWPPWLFSPPAWGTMRIWSHPTGEARLLTTCAFVFEVQRTAGMAGGTRPGSDDADGSAMNDAGSEIGSGPF